MKPEEAIRAIEVAKAECEWSAPLDYQTAFDMAIEALKAQSNLQPTCNNLATDCISRQDAIDNLKRHLNETDVPDHYPGIFNAIEEWLSDWEVPSVQPNSKESSFTRKALDSISRVDAIDAIKTSRYLVDAMEKIIRLPSAEPEPQWIPVSERLPENDKRVLATTAWGDVTIAERIYPPINDTCWFIHDGNTNATIDDVVAWMPLPEPYKGEL